MAVVDRGHLLAQRGERTVAQLAQHFGVAELEACAAGTELAAHDAVGLLRVARAPSRPVRRARRSAPPVRRVGTGRACATSAAPAAAARRARTRGTLRARRRAAPRRARRGSGPRLRSRSDGLRRRCGPAGRGGRRAARSRQVEPGSRAAQFEFGAATGRRCGAAGRGPRRGSTTWRLSLERLQVVFEGCERVGVEQLAQLFATDEFGEQAPVEREGLGAALGHAARRRRRGTTPRTRWRGRWRTATAAACRPATRGSCATGCRAGSLAARARRTRRAGTRDTSRAGSGTSRSCWRRRAGWRCFWRICHSGVRLTRGGGAAAAARAPRSRGSGPRTRRCGRARRPRGLRSRRGRCGSTRAGGGSSASGTRSAMPSSVHITCASISNWSRSRASIAMAHGACTRDPKGDRMQSRQSPSSSRKRSTTICLSVGTSPPLASRWSATYSRRLTMPRSSRPQSSRSVSLEVVSRSAMNLPSRLPNSTGRPGDVGLPERHLARHARRRRDDDLVAGDVFDAPTGRAEQERFAGAALEHHLFVEFADARVVGREHAVEAAIGDGAAADDRQHARARCGR